jgi:hypothetical protein
MFEEARVRGGNAIVGMRFDTSEMGPNWTEICAYGTAVVAVPTSEAAKQTAASLGYGQPGGQGAPQGGPQGQPASFGPPQQGPGGYGQPGGYQPQGYGHPQQGQPGPAPGYGG